jgi:hypothetical protein
MAPNKKLIGFKTKRKNKIKKRSYLKIFIILLLVLAVGVFIRLLNNSLFGNEKKIAVSVGRSDGDAEVIIFNLKDPEITRLLIPGNTEIDSSYNLGKWRVKSLIKLGNQEGIGGGKLLMRSIVKSMKFPLLAWVEGDNFSGIADGNIRGIIKIFYPFKTNLKFRDKLTIAAFTLKVANSKRMSIDLSDTNYLKEVTLGDGEMGYQITRDFPKQLYSQFTYESLLQANPKIVINDYTKSHYVSEEISKIIEIMGSKVTYVYKKEPNGKDGCSVIGKSKDLIPVIAKLFSCSLEVGSGDKLEENVIELNLNEGFEKSF